VAGRPNAAGRARLGRTTGYSSRQSESILGRPASGSDWRRYRAAPPAL